jgi:hypothetical protein
LLPLRAWQWWPTALLGRSITTPQPSVWPSIKGVLEVRHLNPVVEVDRGAEVAGNPETKAATAGALSTAAVAMGVGPADQVDPGAETVVAAADQA